MSKAKKLLREHDAAVVRLAKKLMEAYEIYENSPISACEFVGNLEALKDMVFRDTHDALHELDDDLTDALFERIFGGEEG